MHTVVTGGRTVVAAGRVLGVDEVALHVALRERMRSALVADTRHAGWRRTVQAFAEDMAPFCRDGRFSGRLLLTFFFLPNPSP